MKQPTCFNSLMYWFPKVEELGIPQPRTEIVWLGWERMCGLLDGKALPRKMTEQIMTLPHDLEILNDVGTDQGYKLTVHCRQCGRQKTLYTLHGGLVGLDECARRWSGCTGQERLL